jgi:hypothetical protein
MLEIAEQEGSKPMFSREQVVELVMDADHILTHGGLDPYDKASYVRLDWKLQQQLVAVAFRECEFYGW